MAGSSDLNHTVFVQAYGRDLMEAQDWCRKYMRSGNVKDLTQAWDLYYHVFRRIAKQLPQVFSITITRPGRVSAAFSLLVNPRTRTGEEYSGYSVFCCMSDCVFESPWWLATICTFSQLTSLELQYVSPKLLMCRDLELAVPGTYDPNQPIIRIQSIAPSLQVITSKQRPRKLTIMGKTFRLGSL